MTHYDLSVLGEDQRPYFAARFLGDHVAVEGVSDCLVGEKIPSDDPDQPDGLFVEWHWDGRRLIVRNDFYGFSPLFYASYGKAIRISPSLEDVVKGDGPRDLDYAALEVILRMGHPVGDDTPFRAVRSLPPKSTLIWEQGQLQIDLPELPIRRGPYAKIPFDEATEPFACLFDQAIRKRLPRDDNIVFPLSGGRDPRHILFNLEANGIKPQSCVPPEYRPPAKNLAARVAGLIAYDTNIGHQGLKKAPSWFQGLRKVAHLTNFCGGSRAWIWPLAAYLKSRTNPLYDGVARDVLPGSLMASYHILKLYYEHRFQDLGVLCSLKLGMKSSTRLL